MPVRSPVIATLGHVDHGKTSLLDAIRGSNVASREAGAITQMIGASYVGRESIDTLSSVLAEKMRFQLKIPGLLFIDTPGHEAFTNLRERGGSIADMAILVVDILQGFQPQTVESLRILQQYKTPFVVAANKVDGVHGWKPNPTTSFLESYSRQPEHVRAAVDEKLYALMGALGGHGFDSERFDRITDFTKQIGIVPISAKTREGLSELLVLIGGLSQKFLEARLQVDPLTKAKGSILEVKEEKGLGTTIDVIIYDGVLRKNDEIAFLTPEGVGTARVRGLLEPNLGGKDRFRYVEEVVAAAGVKIFAPGLESALPGSPLKVVEDERRDRAELEAQFRQLLTETDELGVVLCADSLGSLEALTRLLGQSKIPIKETKVGKISRKDVLTAKAVGNENRYIGSVLGFNVAVLPEARDEAQASGIPVLESNIIYDLLDRYQAWVKEEREREKARALAKRPWPCRIRLLPGCCFRTSDPAIFGVDIEAGQVKTGDFLMSSTGVRLGEVKGIQQEKEALPQAKRGMQVALACQGPVYGKDIHENDVLYVRLSGDELSAWEKQRSFLSPDEQALLPTLRQVLGSYF